MRLVCLDVNNSEMYKGAPQPSTFVGPSASLLGSAVHSAEIPGQVHGLVTRKISNTSDQTWFSRTPRPHGCVTKQQTDRCAAAPLHPDIEPIECSRCARICARLLQWPRPAAGMWSLCLVILAAAENGDPRLKQWIPCTCAQICLWTLKVSFNLN